MCILFARKIRNINRGRVELGRIGCDKDVIIWVGRNFVVAGARGILQHDKSGIFSTYYIRQQTNSVRRRYSMLELIAISIEGTTGYRIYRQ